MSIPESCTVLVVGGGPAGSFAAAALAREGIDVVVLEMEKFPRYHIGESMLPSMRHFLKVIDVYDEFNAQLDFLAAGGPDSHAWNVIRSEADEILFKHAMASGARAFDDTKVDAIHFTNGDSDESKLGRPTSASWARRDGSSGAIGFEYLVDASGRNGILCKKYFKNRKFNSNLKNMASWGYWKGSAIYGSPGSRAENMPYFETLQDASGWCWHIPLHDGTHSVGIVLNQDLASKKKHELGSPQASDFYLKCLQLVPRTSQLLSQAKLVSEIKSASDWSYCASAYGFPHVRIIGDAGCFIDPYFSSGVHLAVMGGLSAAVTISASIRGDCDEKTAASWHSKKITESYNRFFMVVSYMAKIMFSKDEPEIEGTYNEGVQNAFDVLQPVLQGTTDANITGSLSLVEMFKMFKFILVALTGSSPEQVDDLVAKLEAPGFDADTDPTVADVVKSFQESLSIEESHVFDLLQNMRWYLQDYYTIDSFTLNPIDGLVTCMEKGKLGLVSADKKNAGMPGRDVCP
ncbi:hypothetical protein L249_0423 [Ophiocordyceps polyrhachis-furcata BCC 54312]|uniref:FAD-binding domain-containing protein n=1 Tax=Ophiocordyceps polyrhachis-furcata BCC 54312 TaxID=1330021 RepID=A0A367LFX1_9HYPO|nr:hypothetical protein L249_0423 [Ophiocordyceps polyrhachis-furcata BCC 54312]